MIAFLALVAAVGLLFVNRTVLRTWWDADAGVNTVEQYAIERVPEVPEWDPVGNMEHALITQELHGTEVEGYRQRLAQVEDELTLHESLLLLTIKLAGCLLAEFLGCTLLFKSVGITGVDRAVLGLLFACFLFWITGEAKRQGGAAKRSLWFALTLVAYVLVMLATTVLRAVQASTENTTWAEELSVAVVMLATTIGTAWLADALNSRSGPSRRLWKERRTLRGRLRKAERRRRAAQAFTVRFARKRERLRRKRAVVAAAYNAAHFRATAQKEQAADRFHGHALGGTP